MVRSRMWAGQFREQDKTVIQDRVAKQVAGGADYLDVNMGAASRKPDDYAWLVQAVAANARPCRFRLIALALDMFRAGLKAYRDTVGERAVTPQQHHRRGQQARSAAGIGVRIQGRHHRRGDGREGKPPGRGPAAGVGRARSSRRPLEAGLATERHLSRSDRHAGQVHAGPAQECAQCHSADDHAVRSASAIFPSA